MGITWIGMFKRGAIGKDDNISLLNIISSDLLVWHMKPRSREYKRRFQQYISGRTRSAILVLHSPCKGFTLRGHVVLFCFALKSEAITLNSLLSLCGKMGCGGGDEKRAGLTKIDVSSGVCFFYLYLDCPEVQCMWPKHVKSMLVFRLTASTNLGSTELILAKLLALCSFRSTDCSYLDLPSVCLPD